MRRLAVIPRIAVLVTVLEGCSAAVPFKVTRDPSTGQESPIRGLSGEGERRMEVLPDLARFEYSQRHMGVVARLILYAPDEPTAMVAAREVFQRLADLDGVLSDYRLDSELTRLVSAPHGRPVPIGPDLFAVLEQARILAELSDGAFDVTAGPLTLLWREARLSGSIPDPHLLAEARERTGWRDLQLDQGGSTATLMRPGMHLDLGAIGKGYAADEALAVLRARGLGRALLEFGGDIIAGNPPPGAEAWEVHVTGAEAPHETIRLVNAAVSSSGATEQFVVIDGVRYSHIVDPRTGLGLTNDLLVTVTAPTATLADALSTLVAIVGPDAAEEMIASICPEASVHARLAAHPAHPAAPAASPLDRPAGARYAEPAE